jgi:release factor glutamine methyltransferase
MMLRIRSALAASGLVPSEARTLLAHVLGCDRGWIAAHAEDELAAAQARLFEALARRRHDGEPVAYLTGRREFYGIELQITPDVLIPRPETELIVDLALERLGERDGTRVLDLGCGSGAIALAIARHRPRCNVLGVDVSLAAVELAQSNAQSLAVANASFAESDWFARLPPQTFDLIASNPPYVADDDVHLVEGDLRFEPPGALRGGIDGLVAIRAVVAGASAFLAPGAWLLIEHGYDQAAAVRSLLVDAGFVGVESRRDLAGIQRVSMGRTAP